MKKIVLPLIMFFCMQIHSAETNEYKSVITGVKVYQNQARIERSTKISLVRGENTVIITALPLSLHDWSIKSSLPKNYGGRIMSVEIEQKMLLERFQKRVGEIEDTLKKLRDTDQEFVDSLKSVKSQDEFIDSVLNFTKINASKELQTRIPQVKVWDETLNYSIAKKRELADKKRKIEREREELGKQIQKWEFELSQIAGESYYTNYQVLNKASTKNIAQLEVQQYADSNSYYAQKKSILKRPTQGTDIEKRLVLKIFSEKDSEIDIDFSYLIPNTYWNMIYDIRASRDNEKIDISLFGNVYQKTGEDWNKVKLSLSTGAPSNSIVTPHFYPWYLDIDRPEDYIDDGFAGKVRKNAYKSKPSAGAVSLAKEESVAEAPEPQTTIVESGAYIDLILPLTQTIVSSERYQKKFVKDISLGAKGGMSFIYEAHPELSREAFLTAEVINSSVVPWLAGDAQVFLENEFMGKVSMPYMPVGKKESIVIGKEPRISVIKELVKKYEDKSGVFGGNKKIVYLYKITVENQMKSENKVVVFDVIPVSRNEKITVEIKNQSHQFVTPADKNETKYVQGERKFEINPSAGKKIEISYNIEIVFDKNAAVNGLK